MLVLLIMCGILSSAATKPEVKAIVADKSRSGASVYDNLCLGELGLSRNAFNLAMKGWARLKEDGQVKKDIISICDFTQSSAKKRLYIVDLAEKKLLFNTWVAHGKNSGGEFARAFSNVPSSLQSSLGFYVTGDSYSTETHGLCLKLLGMERGYNDKAEERAIIMHGAWYAENDFLHQYGILGRSFGCPAIPQSLTEPIINAIKDGTCLFVYYPEKNYMRNSKLLN